MIKAVVNENASMEMSQAAYTDRYNALVDRFDNRSPDTTNCSK